jgi:uncharacterized membrane protein YdjX (TVP38/TMEM64 family)
MVDAGAPTRKKSRVWLRVGALVVVLGGVYVVGKTSGVLDDVDISTIRRLVNDAGAFGLAVYLAIFALGTLAHIPGLVFVATAILLYGKAAGYFAALLGAFIAVCTTFVMVRAIGGTAFASIERPFIRRMLDRLERRPVRVMVVLRVFMFISPPLNYALALSSVRFRDYALSAALGLVIPTAVVTLAFDWLFQTRWIAKLLFG